MSANQPTVDELLAEVDGDPEKAREVLAAEQAAEKPRKTLIDKLEALLAPQQVEVIMTASSWTLQPGDKVSVDPDVADELIALGNARRA